MKARVLLLMAVGLLLAADAKEEAIKKEQDKLIGIWNVSKYEVGGKRDPELEQQLKVVITFEEFNVQQGEKLRRSGYTLDPSAKPKRIDIKPISGPNEGKTLPGIYELDGDTLKVIWNDKEKGRPTEFTTKADSGNQLLTLKKQK